jgi:hypothetical protein
MIYFVHAERPETGLSKLNRGSVWGCLITSAVKSGNWQSFFSGWGSFSQWFIPS